MDLEKARQLIDKYLNGTCTPEEKALVERFYLEETARRELPVKAADWTAEKAAIWKKVAGSTAHRPFIRRLKVWHRIAAAASVILILSAGLHFYFQNKAKVQYAVKNELDIVPGMNKALLTLADGSSISLDDALTGEIAKEAGISITKTADGMLVYDASAGAGSRAAELSPAYNTIETPRGGQYQVILPDGTKVWLNAASSLRYPTRFIGTERKVELMGEGYFEVAKKAKGDEIKGERMPFIVTAGGQAVEVLGTHFNINSYADEPAVRTTLLEGSVKVSSLNTGSSVFLKPGEQSALAGHNLTVSAVNTANAVAWKNGLFQFQDSDIKSVMRQFSRWYDVEVEFEGKMPEIRLWGEVYRDVNASKALEILSYFNLDYKIVQNGNHKKIIISQ